MEWDAQFEPAPEVERAVVQVMTYLIENEAALVVPARQLGRIHPHFREVLQLLAVQAADEETQICFGRWTRSTARRTSCTAFRSVPFPLH